ncbi:diacylglycerol kinase family protein [Hydrogenophaga sp. IBVHS1]|jgi:diacylglycerol kinase family enzyme|uniref:diacylglycerol/lipid kinase family protein n=1 Tax=unclassified Hydrogenophaga TaxID=2610897 RepID=UPI000A2D702D|nr:diacylglycerol kinase family protein [Hydrogenophaga sp. IBVHS1]OSZ74567.1 diacylglycerol kinase [Hydrogenophaga sp. IBVHS1]
MATPPDLDPTATLRFILNGRSGSQDGDGTRAAIESTLQAAGRAGELNYCEPGELPQVAARAARQALAERSAIVAVGGDGTINAVSQAAHASGCAMGVIPRGTFNYFARTHGLPLDVAEATAQLLAARPVPVQVAAINEQVFLVNASVGLYPQLLEDREAWKSRFGRNRLVALGAAFATLMRTPNRLKLSIELDGIKRELRTLTLFVGNNRLQLEQVGVAEQKTGAAKPDSGRVTAVVLKPIGTLGMLRLMLSGALGSLGEAEGIEHFEFEHMVVKPPSVMRLRRMKVAFDGEVARMAPPLRFRVMPEPLYLLKRDTTAKDAA